MGRFAHILLAGLMAALAASGSARADDAPADPLRFFADCAGRLSAELSFRWMFSDPTAHDIEGLRRATLNVLSALTPEGHGREVLSWRTESRAAHNALLTRGTFVEEAWARDRAAAQIARCAHFILGPGTNVAFAVNPTTIPATRTSGP